MGEEGELPQDPPYLIYKITEREQDFTNLLSLALAWNADGAGHVHCAVIDSFVTPFRYSPQRADLVTHVVHQYVDGWTDMVVKIRQSFLQ